jgi:hypothetical protein
MDFPEAMAEYWRLREQHEAGALSDEEFEVAVGDLTVVDAQGDPWHIGLSTGRWYRYDGHSWVEDFPALAREESGGAPSPGLPAQPTASPPRFRPPSAAPADFPRIAPPPGWRPVPRTGARRGGPVPSTASPSKSRLPVAGILVALLVACLCLVAIVAAVLLTRPSSPRHLQPLPARVTRIVDAQAEQRAPNGGGDHLVEGLRLP